MIDHLDDKVSFIYRAMEKVLEGGKVEFEEAEHFSMDDIMALADCANMITRKFAGDLVDVETLINAKSGRCPEDCSFCAQSGFYDSESGINKYPLLPIHTIIEQAKKGSTRWRYQALSCLCL